MSKHTYRVVLAAILTAMALGAFMLESVLPTVPLPGAKIGLANIFSLFALLALGWPWALLVTVVRVVLGCVITGNMGAIIYSLSAGVVACLVGAVLTRRMPRVSVVATAVAMAVAHNITQTLVYCGVVKSLGMLAYLPYLCLFALFGGAVVGFAVWAVCRALPRNVWSALGVRVGVEKPLEPADLPTCDNENNSPI